MSKLLPLLTIAFLALLMSVPVPGTAEEAPAQSDVQAPTARASSTGLEYVYPPANLSRIENHAALLNDTLQRFNLTLENRTLTILDSGMFMDRMYYGNVQEIGMNYGYNGGGPSLNFAYSKTGYLVLISYLVDLSTMNMTEYALHIADQMNIGTLKRNITYVRPDGVGMEFGNRYYYANRLEVSKSDYYDYVSIYSCFEDKSEVLAPQDEILSKAWDFVNQSGGVRADCPFNRSEFITDDVWKNIDYISLSVCYHVDLLFDDDPNDAFYMIQIYYNIHTGDPCFLVRGSKQWFQPDPPHINDNSQTVDWPTVIQLIEITSLLILLLIAVAVAVIIITINVSVGNVQENVHKKHIYETVKAYPGIHFRKIMRNTGLKQGTVAYHLNNLEKQGFVQSRQKGIYRCFFTTDVEGEIGIVLSSIQHAIVYRIKQQPGITVSELARNISRSKMVVSYNTTILASAGIIEKKRVGNTISLFLSGSWERDPRYLTG